MGSDVFCNIQKCLLSEKRTCTSIGTVYARNLLCHTYECASKWRICPSCILQGDITKNEYRNNIFSIGQTISTDCALCEFHSDYGATARRTDQKLVKLITKDVSLPIETNTIKIGNSEFKIVPIPLLSDFEHEYHVRVRKIISAGLEEKISTIVAVFFEGGEALDALAKNMQLFCDMNADILSEMEGLQSIEDSLMEW